jgi:hypothetical protein
MSAKNISKIGFFPKIQSIVLILISIFASFAIFLYQSSSLARIQNNIHSEFLSFKKSQATDKENLNRQLTVLREELIKYKLAEEKSGKTTKEKVLGDVATSSGETGKRVVPTVIGILQLKKSWSEIDVFAEDKASAKIVAQISQGKLYFMYEKKPGWILIDYSLNKFGWIQSSLVDEM